MGSADAMNRPMPNLDAIMHANAAIQAARSVNDRDPLELQRQLIALIDSYTLEPTHTGLRRLVRGVHGCFVEVECVVCVTTQSLLGLLDTIDAQNVYIKWLQGSANE